MAINKNWISTYTSGHSVNISSGNIELEESITMKDSKTGRKWKIKIYDGKLITEPLEKEDIRDKKIGEILKDDSNI